jgi:hypothetical protein
MGIGTIFRSERSLLGRMRSEDSRASSNSSTILPTHLLPQACEAPKRKPVTRGIVGRNGLFPEGSHQIGASFTIINHWHDGD